MFIQTTLGNLKKKCRKTYIRICKNERTLNPEWTITVFNINFWQKTYNKNDIRYAIYNGDKRVYYNSLFNPDDEESRLRYGGIDYKAMN